MTFTVLHTYSLIARLYVYFMYRYSVCMSTPSFKPYPTFCFVTTNSPPTQMFANG